MNFGGVVEGGVRTWWCTQPWILSGQPLIQDHELKSQPTTIPSHCAAEGSDSNVRRETNYKSPAYDSIVIDLDVLGSIVQLVGNFSVNYSI